MIVIQETKFTYDVFDRRIARSVDFDGKGALAAVVTRFIYDGEHVWADFDGSGIMTARYLYADAVDEVLARFRPSEGVAWYLPDYLGTIRDIANASGNVIDHIAYDSFGTVIAKTSPAYGDRIKFTGREFDAETGWYSAQHTCGLHCSIFPHWRPDWPPWPKGSPCAYRSAIRRIH